jgi:broad specificity phosphatase PhoE
MILMRHGQSEFNLHFSATKRDPGIADPRLTPDGQAQAERAAEALADMGITRIVVSPYTRALQTAAPIAQALNVPVIVNPIVRERYHFTCDIGTPRSELSKSWPAHDFAHIEETWWPAGTETGESVEARAAEFRTDMASSGAWSETLVVSHWAFILTLTGESLANGDWMRLPPPAAN